MERRTRMQARERLEQVERRARMQARDPAQVDEAQGLVAARGRFEDREGPLQRLDGAPGRRAAALRACEHLTA